MQGVDLTGTTFATLAGSSESIATVGDSSNGVIKALADVKIAISQLAKDRARIGANIETLTACGNQLSTLNNNLSAANSQITDVDVAQESTRYAKYNILVQTGTAHAGSGECAATIGPQTSGLIPRINLVAASGSR